MDIWYYIMTPFTWLLMFLYQFFNSYGVALILFALVVKLILFPFSLKGKKSMIQMNMLQGKMQKLKKQYGKDPTRYNAEVEKLYAKEGVNPMGGCLWSFIPLLVLFPLYALIRQPLKYMMGMTADQISAVAQAVNWSQAAVDMGWIKEASEFTNGGYDQLYLASLINSENLEAVKTAVASVGEIAKEIIPINFNFLAINLSQIPPVKFWLGGPGGFGLFLIPVISAITSILFSVISMKTNSMNNQNQNAQMARTNRSMMMISPLISLWIGFSMPAALSVYWVANNVLGLVQELVSGRLLKKDYEKAAAEQKRRELEEKEEEKRQRREKAEARAREAEEARKNKNKKKLKEQEEGKLSPEQRDASRVGIRQYARGRAYDPNRYGGVTPYHEDIAASSQEAAVQEEKPEDEGKEAAAIQSADENIALSAAEAAEESTRSAESAEAEKDGAGDTTEE